MTQSNNESFLWSIADALEKTTNDSQFDDIVKLVSDKKNGFSRQMLTLCLAKMKNPNAVDILMELMHDQLVLGHAIMALGKLRAEKAYIEIEKHTNHETTWIRNEAKKALKRIDSSP